MPARQRVLSRADRRFLGDFTDDDVEYRSLLDAGVSFAKTWNQQAGMALTTTQPAV